MLSPVRSSSGLGVLLGRIIYYEPLCVMLGLVDYSSDSATMNWLCLRVIKLLTVEALS